MQLVSLNEEGGSANALCPVWACLSESAEPPVLGPCPAAPARSRGRPEPEAWRALDSDVSMFHTPSHAHKHTHPVRATAPTQGGTTRRRQGMQHMAWEVIFTKISDVGAILKNAGLHAVML